MQSKKTVTVATILVAFALGLATSAYTQERHPLIHSAQSLLEQAFDQLSKADTDFGGHRVKAMEHIRQAQSELKQALQADRI